MQNNNIKKLIILDSHTNLPAHTVTEYTALFNPDGSPVTVDPHDAVAWSDITELPTYIDAIADSDTSGDVRTAIDAAAAVHTHIGDDVVLTGYVIDDPQADGWDGTVAATDNLTEVIAKLEARIVELEAFVSEAEDA